MTTKPKERMQQLVEELNRASQAYYNGQSELMTDYEWDARFDELRQIEEETGEILPESPTQRVSEDHVEGRKEEHEFAALSLAKTKQIADLVKWAEGKPIWISWKLDGLTLVATYDRGRLSKVITRGNGHIGTNITHLASAINGILPTIDYQGHVVIRGEAVISYSDFEDFLIESGEDYANPRNLASGTLTLKDVGEVRRRKLQWIPFTLVHIDDNIPSWGERMAWLARQGFMPVERQAVNRPTTEAVQTVIDGFTDAVTKEKNPFPVDGLVVCYDDTAYAQTGSVTGHHATRAGLAFKWQDETAETELDHVEWSCAASTISPVAVFRPVELEGTTVKRASLCNISECERLGIGGKGTKISVIKANKIIPKVISVSEQVGSLEIPEECPVCHHATQITESEQSGTRKLQCTNPVCAAKQLKKFARFVSKEGMNIDGISEQTLSRFVNLGWIHEYADIFLLTSHIRDIAGLEGFGERSATNIRRSIERAKETEAQRLLFALTIPMVGIDVCKRLLGSYPLEELIKQAREAASTDFFAHIDGIGPEKSAAFINWFRDDNNFNAVRRLLELVTVTQTQQQTMGKNCEGLTFVITGDVHHYKNRNELKAYIESQGGKVTGSVSKSTSFLINNDVTSTSGKNRKAQELGIPILSEEAFIQQFGTDNRQQSAPQEGNLF